MKYKIEITEQTILAEAAENLFVSITALPVEGETK